MLSTLARPLPQQLDLITTSAPPTIRQQADQAAARSVFAQYRARKAENTVRRQDGDLHLFADYLQAVGITVEQLQLQPDGWQMIGWGIVQGFVAWMLQQGYAIDSINVRLATVKTYARLAMQAGGLDVATYAQIKTIAGYRQREGRNIDRTRSQTRVGAKKAAPNFIDDALVTQLKTSGPATPAGARDRLLLCILFDHGLRVSEVEILEIAGVDLRRGTLCFYRPKVDRTQTHALTPDTRAALDVYLDQPGAPVTGRLFRATRRDGALTDGTLGARAIEARVCRIGQTIGLSNLSPHDARHTWATLAARAGTPLNILQDAGGWSSPAMPLRYLDDAAIANQGLLLR